MAGASPHLSVTACEYFDCLARMLRTLSPNPLRDIVNAAANSRERGSCMSAEAGTPIGDLTLRTLAMPADANAAGDIFGGWVMAQMDLACGIRAAERAKGRVVTAAVKEMSFAKAMKVGDTLGVYISITRIGRTSMTLRVEAWAQRYLSDLMERVTHADFIMVALDGNGKPKEIPAE